MTTIAYVFPGQGSQVLGMGRSLADASPAAAAVFAAADDALGSPISRLAWDGPADELDQTENAQPALLATSIAYLAALEERWAEAGIDPPVPSFYAGHSMGQYSAMVAAGVIELADGVRLVRERGRLMQASGAGREGRMAAIIGLDDDRLPELVERAGGVRRAAGGRERRRDRPGARRQAGDRAARLGGRPLAADGRRGRRNALGARRGRLP
jgi:[acyl-carrier-protein] S-malonyltransferase